MAARLNSPLALLHTQCYTPIQEPSLSGLQTRPIRKQCSSHMASPGDLGWAKERARSILSSPAGVYSPNCPYQDNLLAKWRSHLHLDQHSRKLSHHAWGEPACSSSAGMPKIWLFLLSFSLDLPRQLSTSVLGDPILLPLEDAFLPPIPGASPTSVILHALQMEPS